MKVVSHDQGYVEAPPDRVYARLADLVTYEEWWSGLRTRTTSGHGGSVEVVFAGRRFVGVEATRHRPGIGVVLKIEPPLPGTLEWYLEPFRAGTIVSAILEIDLRGGRRGTARRLLRLRARIRRGLVGLARALE